MNLAWHKQILKNKLFLLTAEVNSDKMHKRAKMDNVIFVHKTHMKRGLKQELFPGLRKLTYKTEFLGGI
jgi:hypothetical protein